MKRWIAWFSLIACSAIFAHAASLKNLSECEQIALNQHPSILLAKEELEVARLKKQEAQRALYPSLQLRAERTRGKADSTLGTPDFTEENYGTQLNQTLFQGGKLLRTYQQSRSNAASLEAKYNQTQGEIIYALREAYFNLQKTEKIFKVYLGALFDCDEEMQKIKKLKAAKFISEQTVLSASAQHYQAKLQLQSAEAEKDVRLWQWATALGLESPPDYQPAPPQQKGDFFNVKVEDCLKQAQTTHPQIKTQSLALDAARYGEMAAASIKWPQLDLNGSYGRSGGAFDGETLKLEEDWQVALRASIQFGGQTLTPSVMRQKTSKKLGQSSRTEIETVSGAISFLDTFKSRTERGEAKLALHQSQEQLRKTRTEIANGVRESYSDLLKALLQLKASENNFQLASTDYKVTRIKAAHSEVSPSEVLVAINKLAQAETALIEAESGYAIAVAALNKAMGVLDYNNFFQKIFELR